METSNIGILKEDNPTFGSICSGDAFWWDGGLKLKIARFVDGRNYVNLENGLTGFLGDSTFITKVYAVVQFYTISK